MEEVPGWDARILNEEMLEMVRREYPETAERIETKSYYRWQEEHKKALSVLGQMSMELANGLMFYECMIAEKPYWERIERERAYRATKEAGGETAKENGENGNGETENRENGGATGTRDNSRIEAPERVNYDSNQVGKKWGKHKTDYPEMENYNDYINRIENTFNNPDKIVFDAKNNEYLYINGEQLLRLGESGEFISLYPGANSARVTNAIENGGVIWP